MTASQSPANLFIALAASRPAMAERAQISAIVANRPTNYRVRCHPPLIRQPLNRRTTRRIGSIQISQITRGTQIPIASAAPPFVPSSAVSSLGGFRTPAAEHAALSFKRPASETLHINRSRTAPGPRPL